MASQADRPVMMPMKLIASWDLERTTTTCVPRLCTLTLTNLEALRPLEPGLQRITIAVALKGSRHTLRSNDIEISSNGIFSMNLQITFALQYPHFIKRDVNVLRVMLQRRKRYKTTPIPGYRTLAVGQVNLSEVIQHDVGSELFLYAPKNKDKGGEAEHVSTVSLGVLTSQAVDTARHNPSMLPQDGDSSDEEQDQEYEPSDEDDTTTMPGRYDERLPAQQQHRAAQSQRLQALHLLKGMAKKRLNRGKFFQFPRRGKLSGVEGEVYPEEQEGMDMDEDAFGGSDFMHSDDSDSDFDLDPDKMSIRSTPKPILRPFYAPSTTNSSSASLRGAQNTVGDNKRDSPHQPPPPHPTPHGPRGVRLRVEQAREKAERTLRRDLKDIKLDDREQSLGRDGRLEKDLKRFEDAGRRSQSGEEQNRLQRRDKVREDDHAPRKSSSIGDNPPVGILSPAGTEPLGASLSSTAIPIPTEPTPLGSPLTQMADCSSSDFTPTKPVAMRQRSSSALPIRRAHTVTPQRASAAEVSFFSHLRGTVSSDLDPETIVKLNEGCAADRVASLLVDMPPHIILVNAGDPHGMAMTTALSEANMPVICTASAEHVQTVMMAIVTKLQKYGASHTNDPCLGLCLVGSEGYVNTILRVFIKLLHSRSSIKLSFFRFFIVPLGVNRLASFLASLDSTYRSLFQDSLWREMFDTHDGKWDHMPTADLVSRLERYLSMGKVTRQLPVAQALVNRAKPSGENETGQIYVYFLNEVRVGNVDYTDLHAAADDMSASAASMAASERTQGMPVSSTIVANPLIASDQVLVSQSPPQSQGVSRDNSSTGTTPITSSSSSSSSGGILDLSLEYWPISNNTASSQAGSSKKEKEFVKLTARPTVRCAFVTTLPTNVQGQPSPPSAFTMVLVPKEKSKRALPFPLPRRSHGRDKEKDSIEIAYISKLVCSPPKRGSTLKVYIDTVEWADVKFFSLFQPSRTLHFPVAMFSGDELASVQANDLDATVCTMSDV